MHPGIHRSTVYNGQDTQTTSMSIYRKGSRRFGVYIYICTHIYTHTTEYYSVSKKNEIRSFAAI